MRAILVEKRRLVDEMSFCSEHGAKFLAERDSQCKVFAPLQRDQLTLFDVEMVALDGAKDWHPIYLREVGGHGQCFPLYAGMFEASELYWRFKEPVPPRPLTHHIMGAIIQTLGGKLQDIVVNELATDELMYRAQLRIAKDENLWCIDARPSDAVSLASVCGAPIYISDRVLEVVSNEK